MNKTEFVLTLLRSYQPFLCSRRDGRAPAGQRAPLAELPPFPCREIIGARQVRPAPLYWGLDLERVALAGPIPEPHAP